MYTKTRTLAVHVAVVFVVGGVGQRPPRADGACVGVAVSGGVALGEAKEVASLVRPVNCVCRVFCV